MGRTQPRLGAHVGAAKKAVGGDQDPPALWQLRGYEPCWAVGLIGTTVLYYNRMESGFNRSPWTQFGVIDQYQSMDWSLEALLEHQLAVIAAGSDMGPWAGEPQAGEFVPASRKPAP